MKRLILAISVFALLSVNANAEDKIHEYIVKHRQTDTYQEPKQLDCQLIAVDDAYLNGIKFAKKICFYDVIIDGQHMIMWREVGFDRYGFVK